jgi:hypothetical protein
MSSAAEAGQTHRQATKWGDVMADQPSHGLLVEKPEVCNRAILDFLTTDPVPTMAPIRRAPAA